MIDITPNVEDLYKDLDADTQSRLKKLAEHITECYSKGDRSGQPKGRVILFLGAAANRYAPAGFEQFYKKDDSPPLGGELAELLINDLFPRNKYPTQNDNFKEQHLSLQWVSQLYEQYSNDEINFARKDRRELILQLYNHLDNKKPSPILKALAEMPFKYIISTNYDNLFEDALKSVNKENHHKGIYKPNKYNSEHTFDVPEKEVTTERPFLYKLHGDINDVINEEGEYRPQYDSIVITDEDYLHFILRMSQIDSNIEKTLHPEISQSIYPIPQSINQAFNGLNEKTFLFIGYGLKDYNLRLILKTALWKKDANVLKAVAKYSIDFKPDAAIKNILIGDYNLTFIERDIWHVIPYLYELIFNKKMPLE